MKRIHLFEFEDLRWFPDWLRDCLTRLVGVMHKILKTEEHLAELLAPIVTETGSRHLVDLCSGSGGPMPTVAKKLRHLPGMQDLELTLTDLYPNQDAIRRFNTQENGIRYKPEPVDATEVDNSLRGIRTMVSSFHHMKPADAKKILKSAFDSRQSICIFEISDNSFPVFLWWIALPMNFLSCFFVTLMVRPLTWQQVVFTYLIPIIPLLFAWDGAVSNVRTYTIEDMNILLRDLHAPDYEWKSGKLNGNMKKLYLVGVPR